MPRESVAAVVSTYNRKDYLRKCVNSLLRQTRIPDEIIVIDGPSTDGTREMIKNEFPQVTYIRIEENIGGAGQFYIGLKTAYRRGHDFVWVMDDDVEIIRRDGLEILLRIYYAESEKAPIGAVIPLQLTGGKIARVGPLSIFVGGLIPRKVIEKVGFPRYDFFIYYDDVEYAFRILNAGFAIKYAPPILEHKGWPQRRSWTIRLMGREYTLPILTKKRMYYLVRNGIIFTRTYKQHRWLASVLAGAILRAIPYAAILNEYDLPLYVARGIIEGFLNITQTQSQRKPAA